MIIVLRYYFPLFFWTFLLTGCVLQHALKELLRWHTTKGTYLVRLSIRVAKKVEYITSVLTLSLIEMSLTAHEYFILPIQALHQWTSLTPSPSLASDAWRNWAPGRLLRKHHSFLLLRGDFADMAHAQWHGWCMCGFCQVIRLLEWEIMYKLMFVSAKYWYAISFIYT